jgi:hypothetical protein
MRNRHSPAAAGYPLAMLYSVTDAADGELIADELLERAEALAIAAANDGQAWAHGRYEGAKVAVRWRIGV